MNCIATNKKSIRLFNKKRHKNSGDIAAYFSVATIEILLEKYNWSHDRIKTLINQLNSQFEISTENPYISLSDYRDILKSEYNFELDLKYEYTYENKSVFSSSLLATTKNEIEWFCDVLSVILFDKYGWSNSTVDKFFKSYMSKYVKNYNENLHSIDDIVDNILNTYQYNL